MTFKNGSRIVRMHAACGFPTWYVVKRGESLLDSTGSFARALSSAGVR